MISALAVFGLAGAGAATAAEPAPALPDPTAGGLPDPTSFLSPLQAELYALLEPTGLV